ncbi:MAG: XdhC family protein [Solobacterium sp.]|nr:XdhC family protein [Solobacterium sp.]
MKEFYEQISSLNPNTENRTLITLDDTCEKVILCNHEPVWYSRENGFFRQHEEEVRKADITGTGEIAGVKVYGEILGHEKKIVICGAGHVSMPIIRISKMIGCHVTVIEDRPQFAANAAKAGADTVICDEFEKALDTVEGNQDTFFVIVTRGHQWDTECLRAILKKPSAYVGMMGSARRVRIVLQGLIEEGLNPEKVNAVHTPIGLKIKAETPEEIAVSVMAEIILVKNEKKDVSYDNEILSAIIGGRHTEPLEGRKIIATIVSRKGSAPRDIGTKMILCESGKNIGTIGGGCTEAAVITRAAEMFADTESRPDLIHVDLMADEAAEEGEVCGGLIDVWMEEI